MSLPLSARLIGSATALTVLLAGVALSQKPADPKKDDKKPAKKGASTKTAEEMLKPAPRPKKAPLPPSELPLKFVKGERIAFVGNSLGERLAHFGNFEAMLHYRHPDLNLVIRNFCRPADEVSIRQRSSDYSKLDDPLHAFNPDTLFCFFGYNESFAGPDGLSKFKADYEKFLDEYTKKYPRDDAGSPPRFVLVSPIPNELSPQVSEAQSKLVFGNLALYANAVEEIAKQRKLAFIDVFVPMKTHMAGKAAVTTNGVHLDQRGSEHVAVVMDKSIHGAPGDFSNTEKLEKLRKVAADKDWIHSQDHRMLNGWYVYGGRRTFDTETFPREYVKIRNMAAVRDQYLWDIANGKPVPAVPDDSKTGELIVPPTRFGQGSKSEEPKGPPAPNYLSPEALIKSCTVPEGFEIKLFADEKQFPELAKPVQLNFDSKGRLWCSTMPSYPQWKPGDPKPNDKLIYFEDTDGDGKADKCTVFYDKLQCPTGFEFWNGGVLVVDQPRIIFLKDTDNDGKADLVIDLIDGLASDDTHHTAGAFEWSHGGYLQMLEGVSMSTAVETPWGAFRNFGSSGAYSLDPKSLKLTHYNTPGYGNPWCYVYNDWGQGIVGDGTGAKQHWDTLLSGPQFSGRKSVDATIDPAGMRPVVGSDFLRTRQFPDEVQNQFIFACVINMNGLTRFDFKEDGSGYTAKRTTDLLASSHKHFRPVDPQVGPDGTIWFGDWANALIGHMQYSQRDPNRDHSLGRIYRLVYTKKPLLKPVTQDGKTLMELFDQLKEYENRTRYRARRELWARPEAEVVAAAKAWVSQLDVNAPDYDKYCCEALWVLQGHRVVDLELLNKVLKSKTPNARAAAAKIVTDERERIPVAKEMLIAAAGDPSPRVQIEAVRGLGWFRGADATDAILNVAKQPLDKWLTHLVQTSLGATQANWINRYNLKQIGQEKAVGAMLNEIVKADKASAEAAPYMATLLGAVQKSQEEKNKAMSFLAGLKGNADKGKAVFRNGGCVACHKIHNEGADYGPELTKIGSKKDYTKFKVIQSIIEPNAEIDDKYLTTKVETVDGKAIQGLLVSTEKNGDVVIFDGKEKKTIKKDDIEKVSKLKQSSMPEGLAGTISPAEFLDLVEYLWSLK
ncbi:c-type cytochrome [soil metagenome]